MTSAVFRIKPKPMIEPQKEEEEFINPSSLFNRPQQSTETQEEKQSIQFPFEEENDLEREIERSRAQTTSRILETILGTPGNIQSLITSITGLPSLVKLPTSEKLQKLSEKATAGYTKPRTKFEEKTGDISSDIATMIFPGSNNYGFFRTLGIPLAGAGLKEILEKSGSEEGKSNLAKTGLMFALDLASQRKGMGGAKKVATDLLNAAEESTLDVPRYFAPKFRNDLENYKSFLLRGGSDPSKTPILTKVDEILKMIDPTDHIDSLELPRIRKSVNTLVENMGGFDPAVPTSIKKKTIYNFDKLKEILSDADKIYGEINPEYIKLQKAGNEAFAAYSKSNAVSNILRKSFGDKVKSGVLKTILGIGAPLTYGTIKSPVIGLLAGTGGAAGAGAYTAIKYLYRIFKSPVLRKHYTDLINAAAAGNIPAASKNIKVLDKMIGHMSKDEKSET